MTLLVFPMLFVPLILLVSFLKISGFCSCLHLLLPSTCFGFILFFFLEVLEVGTFRVLVMDRETWHAAVHGSQRVGRD